MENEQASVGGRHLAQRRRRRPTALLAAACILLVLALGIGGFVVFVNQPAQSLACREGNLPLHVVVSPDQAGVVTQAAAEYERRRPAVDDRCVDVQVRGTDSAEAAAALSTGWDESTQGPRPDVWVPAASTWALQVALRQQASGQAVLIPLEYPKLATTPMVMAMPKPMAEAIGWPRTTVGWRELIGVVAEQKGWKTFGHPEWGAFKLGKTDPNLSTPGMEALIAAVFAATGQTSELSVETLVKQEDQLRRVILGLERAPGQDADTPATFLANLQQADQAGQTLDFVSAVPLDEKSVWDYNRGNASGLEDGGERAKPEVPLVAVYPKEGTLEADHPWVVLRAPWVDETKRRAAAGFLDYLRSEPIQTRFQEAGFRTSEGRPGPQLIEANGLVPDQPARVLAPPAPKVVAAALQSWNAARKRSNVLAVYDVSGSMKEEVPGTGGKTKMDIVKAAAGQALGLFAPETNLGTWVFSSNLAGGRDWAESVPIGPTNARLPNGKVRREVLAEALANLQATDGDTGLYDTTLAAFRALQRSYAPQRINIVVLLTDGINDDPTGGIDRAELLRRLKAEQRKDQPVRIITVAYGADADADLPAADLAGHRRPGLRVQGPARTSCGCSPTRSPSSRRANPGPARGASREAPPLASARRFSVPVPGRPQPGQQRRGRDQPQPDQEDGQGAAEVAPVLAGELPQEHHHARRPDPKGHVPPQRAPGHDQRDRQPQPEPQPPVPRPGPAGVQHLRPRQQGQRPQRLRGPARLDQPAPPQLQPHRPEGQHAVPLDGLPRPAELVAARHHGRDPAANRATCCSTRRSSRNSPPARTSAPAATHSDGSPRASSLSPSSSTASSPANPATAPNHSTLASRGSTRPPSPAAATRPPAAPR